LAQEVAPFGIKLLIVEPGASRTNLSAGALKFMPGSTPTVTASATFATFAHNMGGTEGGDPYKAARAIDLTLAAETTPLRCRWAPIPSLRCGQMPTSCSKSSWRGSRSRQHARRSCRDLKPEIKINGDPHEAPDENGNDRAYFPSTAMRDHSSICTRTKSL
jgi:hypothetical protein